MNYTPSGRPPTDGVFLWVKRISIEVKQEALKLFKEGLSSEATATLIGLSRSTVQNWYESFRGGDDSWSKSSYVKTSVEIFELAVDEYLNTERGCCIIAAKYGITTGKLLRAKNNFVNFGLVALPQGRNSMKRLQEQKLKLKDQLQSIEVRTNPLTDEKSHSGNEKSSDCQYRIIRSS